MKAAETKSTHSQQHGAAEKSAADQEHEGAFFSELASERRPFFNPSSGTGIQAKFATERGSFFQPVRTPAIQMKCADCATEERKLPEQPSEMPMVQRMPAIESDEAGIQRKPISGVALQSLQRIPAFESEGAVQAKAAPQVIADDAANAEQPLVQFSLTIGQPGDAYEREADAIADRVVSMPEGQSSTAGALQAKPLAEKITPIAQRQAILEKEKPVPTKGENFAGDAIQRSADNVPQVQPDLESQLNSSKGGGSPLPKDVRSFMEPRFGADFSQVRVHTGSDAVQMNQELNAHAFTHQQDVYFGAGKAPAKDALTAHELTHVIQQANASIQRIQRLYGDDALNDAETDAVEALKWLNGQSMDALITILKRGRSKGVLGKLLAGLEKPEEINAGSSGIKRLRAAIRAVQMQGKAITSSDQLEVKLLMDEAGLPSDQRQLIEKLLVNSRSSQQQDGLTNKLVEGDFKTVFAMLNGMSMEAMLKRLKQLGFANLTYLAANTEAADFLGEKSRLRLESAVGAVAISINGATAVALDTLKDKMDKAELPSDQQAAIRSILPSPRGGNAGLIAEYFKGAELSPFLIPTAVNQSFQLLNGLSDEDMSKTLEQIDKGILRSLISNAKRAEGKYDAERLKQLMYQAWTKRYPKETPPFDTRQPSSALQMTPVDKLSEAIANSGKYMGPELWQQVKALIGIKEIAAMVAFTLLFIALEAVPGVGQFAALALSAYLIGPLVNELLEHIQAFLKATDAVNPEDLEVAGEHFAKAVIIVGVNILLAIVIHKVVKAVKGPVKEYFKPTPPMVDMVAEGGQIIRGPVDEIPDNVLASKGTPKGGPKEKGKGAEAKSAKEELPSAVPPWKGPVDYSSVPNPKKVGPGLKYSENPAHREAILEHNRQANDGMLRSDIDGSILDPPEQAKGGKEKNMNQAEVDHKEPRIKDGRDNGPNSSENAQVISARQNAAKRNK